MTTSTQADQAIIMLQTLCSDLPTRCVGSEGNQAATAFFARVAAASGFELDYHPFTCIAWTDRGASLHVHDTSFEVFTSPYSLGCQVSARLVVITSATELEAVDVHDQIVLLRGEITTAQFMPKNFPFFQIEEQQRIISLLEQKHPAAIITATTRNPEMAGALYPFPVFEDGDFDIPSVFMTEETGLSLSVHQGQKVTLQIEATRAPAQGQNVIARRGRRTDQRIVFFAHIDAKEGTLGATDNGTGVVTLLLLADLLADYQGELGVEIVAMNGEDYYANPGEKQYLSRNADRFGEIILGVNLDGLGYHRGHTAYSLYNCPESLAQLIQDTFAPYPELVSGEPWYQSDHALFLMHERPALAITSTEVVEMLSSIIHSSADRPEIVDPGKLVLTAQALHDLVMRVDLEYTHRHP